MNLSRRLKSTAANIMPELMLGHTWKAKRARQWRFSWNATFARRSLKWLNKRMPGQRTFSFRGPGTKFVFREQLRAFTFREEIEIMSAAWKKELTDRKSVV